MYDGEETVEVTKKRSTRKRKSIRYRESSEEENHSSDPDYMEKPKRKQKLRKRSHRKVSDGIDKDVVVPFVETSEAPEDTILHEIIPGTSQQSSTPPEISEFLTPEISEDIATSREDTSCPVIQSTQRTPLDTISTLQDTSRSVIQSTQQATIFTSQKPIITKTMYDRYSPYLICAFNVTINYTKETIEEGTTQK